MFSEAWHGWILLTTTQNPSFSEDKINKIFCISGAEGVIFATVLAPSRHLFLYWKLEKSSLEYTSNFFVLQWVQERWSCNYHPHRALHHFIDMQSSDR